MGHRITTQSRGKGGPSYRAPSHRYKAELKHIGDDTQKITGSVIDIEHDPARNAPIALVRLKDGAKVYMLVTEGLGIGEEVTWGSDVEVKNGNTLTLQHIPTGTYICNIESRPNDGGKFVRASGVQAVVIDKIEDRVGIRMPSGKTKWFNHRCRATIGIVAGGGRGDKPFVKAGNKYHKMQNTASKLATRPGCSNERHRPPIRWWRSPAYRSPENNCTRDLSRQDCRTCGCTQDR
jgi:Ribosomal protein L2